MEHRKLYQEVAARLQLKEDTVTELILSGPDAGEKKILTQEEESQRVEKDSLIECFHGKPEVVICGGGHVSLALVRLLAMLDFSITVTDERPEFASMERFPEADQVCCMDFSSFFAEKKFGKHGYYVIVTRGHKDDYSCLKEILKREYDYVGMIGSRAKVALSFERLEKDGFSKERIASVHAPIGLDIKAQTPAEIAVSIAAQMIQEKSRTSRNVLEDDVIKGIYDTETRTMVTVIEKSGSSPRGKGSRMVVKPDGQIYGTIGGGAVEFAAIEEAKNFRSEKGFGIREYNLSSSGAASLGMVCGGNVKVLFESL